MFELRHRLCNMQVQNRLSEGSKTALSGDLGLNTFLK